MRSGRPGALRLPNFLMPPLMSNHGNFIVSLGDVCRYLAKKAEALGVEIYPGFAAAEVLFENGAVAGIATGDMGVGKDGAPQDRLHPRHGIARQVHVVRRGRARQPDQDADRALCAWHKTASRRKFGIGLKELWQVAPEKHRRGLVQHTIGWPLDNRTGGGSFLYHFDDNLVSVGFVVHLNYENPYLSPFEEFQRFKTHPLVRDTFAGGKRISYGARAITEGGYQSVPKLSFPGGALIGCAAGFVNVPRIKGSHNAMLSGMLAAEHVAAALAQGRANDELADYEAAWRSSPIGRDLWRVRNAKPLWSKLGTFAGIALGGLDMWTNTLGFSLFGTLKHGKADFATLEAGSAMPADRLSKTRRQADLRPAVVGLSVEHQSRGGPAGASVWCATALCKKPPSTTSMPGRRRAIARPASTNGSRRAANRASSSTRRTASTAKPATSRTPTRTSPGCRPKAAAGRITRICDCACGGLISANPAAISPPLRPKGSN